MMNEIIIDPGFKHLIPSLTPEEYKGLEEKLLAEGFDSESYGKIILWNNTIIDGHNRYEICVKHNIAFETTLMEFDSREDVIDWMYSNQLDKRNLTDEKRKYLMGKQYEARKRRWSNPPKYINVSVEGQNDPQQKSINTSSKIAEEQGVSEKTVKRAAEYSSAIDAIAENVVGKPDPEKINNEDKVVGIDILKNKILTGEIRSSTKDVVDLAKKTIEDQKKIIKSVEEGKQKDLKSAIQSREKESRREELSKKCDVVKKLPDTITIYTGDFLTDYKKLGGGSVDCIITDPPYVIEWLNNYAAFAEAAAYVLKPGGFLITYVGHIHMDKILEQMTPHLDYYWILCLSHRGHCSAVHSRGVQCTMKPVLVFQKPPRTMPKQYFKDIIEGSGREKNAHEWQQGEEELRQIFEPFTDPGDIVLDPFMGSGTTLSMAKKLDRRAIGFDIDATNVEIVKGRLT